MQFTPQQLSGGQKFSSTVKIGNWAEDRARVEAEAKDYEFRRSKGMLLTTKGMSAHAFLTQKVPHSFSADGKLRFGDTIQLQVNEEDAAAATQSHYLACNIFQQVDWQRRTVQVSGCKDSTPTARNTFVIMRPKQRKGPHGVTLKVDTSDVLTYGTPFYLACNPSLRVDGRTGLVAPLVYLASEVSSSLRGGGGASSQQVYMERSAGPSAEWVFAAADGNNLAKDGTPVPIGEDVAVIHKITNQKLCASLARNMGTDFGAELVVSGATIKLPSRPGLVAALPGNRWRVITAADPSAAVDTRDLHFMTPDIVLEKVRETLAGRGAYGFRGLSKTFLVMDARRDGTLDREDFRFGMRKFGIDLEDDEFDVVYSVFDRDGNGVIAFPEFLRTVRGEMSAKRLALVEAAYRKFDRDGSGTITLADLEAIYDTSFHPGVAEGAMTAADALSQFLDNWDTQKKDGVVSLDEFVRYYSDLSATIDDDAYFELMMRNAWHL